MENVIGVPSAARVNVLSWGKILPLIMTFFVVFALAVAIVCPF